MAGHDQQLDKIYEVLSPRGKFTIIQLTLLLAMCVASACQLLSNVFIGPFVSHHCASPTNESVFINTYRDVIKDQNITVSYTQCEIHIKSDDTLIKREACLFGMEYDLPVESSFATQFGLVCDSTNLARLTQTLVIVGQAFGALLGALLSDRLGRRPVVIGASMGLLLTGIAIAYSTNFVMFSVFKFMVGGFQQAVVSVGISMEVEMLMSKDRRIVASVGGLIWACSVMLLGLIAYILRDHSWRTLQLVISLAGFPALFQIFFLKESLRWLLANGKTEEASDYIRGAAKMNGKSQGEIIQALEMIVNDAATENMSIDASQEPTGDNGERRKSSKKMTYLDIFRHPRLFLNTFVLWIGWFTVALGFFAIYLDSTTLSGDRFLNFFLTALMEAPSNIYFYFVLNRYGRKNVVVCMFMTLSAGLIGCGIFRSLENTKINSGLSVAFNMVAMAGASGGFGILFFYTPEIFPTNIRNQALGMSSLMARVGGMLAPFTSILSDQAKWGPGVLIGCLACLVAVLIRFLPETNGRELPQTLEDMQRWFKKDNGENDKMNDEAGVVLVIKKETIYDDDENGSNSVI